MLRYEIIGANAIEVNLRNGYTVMAIANWNKTEHVYNMSAWLRENNTHILDKMENFEDVVFEESTRTTIVKDMTEYISSVEYEGGFDYYIIRYTDMLKCMDKGRELLEKNA